MAGEATLFDDFPPTNDEVYSSSTSPLVVMILQILYGAFSTLILHLVEEHLPGGKLCNH